MYLGSTSFTDVADQDLTDLGNQIKDMQNGGRIVFLRFLPEMNGML